MTPEQVKRFIWSRCHSDGDCLLWDGAVTQGGVPTLREPNTKKLEPTRRVLLRALGVEVHGKVATTTCDNPLCMAEEHIAAWTRKQLQKRNGLKATGNVVRKAKLAKYMQAKSKLTMEIVREMRSVGMTAKEASERYGVPEGTAAAALNGRCWKEYGSPWAGLGI